MEKIERTEAARASQDNQSRTYRQGENRPGAHARVYPYPKAGQDERVIDDFTAKRLGVPEAARDAADIFMQFARWNRAVSTVGASVRHRDQGWTGRVVRPAARAQPGASEVVLVEHGATRPDDPQVVQRFYPALDLLSTKETTA